MKGFLFVLFSLCASLGSSQTVELRKVLTGIDCLETVGGTVFVSADSSPVVETVGYVDLGDIPEKPDRLVFVVSDVNRVRLTDAVTIIGHGKYVIRGKGRVWLDVNVRDKATGFYMDRLDLPSETLDLPGTVPPGPTPPGPNPPNPPGPQPDVPIANEYGVGIPAYTNAADKDTALKIAAVYKAAGDFLSGIPTFKFITSDDPVANKDPNKCVLAWMDQQIKQIPCKDEQTCKKWAAWNAAMRAAFDVSQSKKQFTRADWYAAFNEVSSALRAVK